MPAPWDLPDELWARVLRACFAREGPPLLEDSEALDARWRRRLAACCADGVDDRTWRGADFPEEPPPGWSRARWDALRGGLVGGAVEAPYPGWRRHPGELAWKQEWLRNSVFYDGLGDWCAALAAAAPDDADPWFRRRDFPPFPPPSWGGVEYADACAGYLGRRVQMQWTTATLRAAGYLGNKHYQLLRMVEYR
jgi:hypothetical protein